MINPQWFELPISRTKFHGPKDVRAIDVRLYMYVGAYLRRNECLVKRSFVGSYVRKRVCTDIAHMYACTIFE